jgi:ribosomal protein S12
LLVFDANASKRRQARVLRKTPIRKGVAIKNANFSAKKPVVKREARALDLSI